MAEEICAMLDAVATLLMMFAIGVMISIICLEIFHPCHDNTEGSEK